MLTVPAPGHVNDVSFFSTLVYNNNTWLPVHVCYCALFQINGFRDVMTAYYNAMRFWKFGLITGIFVRDRIYVIIIIHFGGNLFRYYLVFVWQIIIIFVIVIVN